MPAGADRPHPEFLSDGGVRTFLLVFHTGQEVMAGLRTFAHEHKPVLNRRRASHVAGRRDASLSVAGPWT
jgi:hypothetical protein